MKEEQDIELIELYIQNRLDKSERDRVDSRLKTENEFKELFKDVEILLKGIKTATRKQLADELKAIEDNIPPETKVVSINRTYWVGAAAVAALIALFAVWRTLPSSPNAKLFAEYFEPYPNVLVSTVRGENAQDELLLALQLYEQEEYTKAIGKLEGIGDKDFGTYFYLGSSYLAINDADKAITNFEMSLQSKNKLNTQAEWYLALSYLHSNNLEKCIALFNSIVAKQNVYSSRAEKILASLGNH